MKDNREISIREIFLHIFKHWKAMIIAAVVGAIILGGYSYYQSVKKHNAALEAQKEEKRINRIIRDLTASEEATAEELLSDEEKEVSYIIG